MKSLRIGRGLSGGFECYVFFPDLQRAVDGMRALSIEEQSVWYEDIFLPSAIETLEHPTIQRLPTSFQELLSKRTRTKSRTRTPESVLLATTKYPLVMSVLLPFL